MDDVTGMVVVRVGLMLLDVNGLLLLRVVDGVLLLLRMLLLSLVEGGRLPGGHVGVLPAGELRDGGGVPVG